MHQLIQFLHYTMDAAINKQVPGAELGSQLLLQIDQYKEDTWVHDKQHRSACPCHTASSNGRTAIALETDATALDFNTPRTELSVRTCVLNVSVRRYWMHKWVKRGKDIGKNDTPASMIVRACDAYANRPVFGTPSEQLVPAAHMPRTSSRYALVEAAQMQLEEKNDFCWLTYDQLGWLVQRVAKGLVSMGLPDNAKIAIAGYNDIEWMVTDFAIAVAGFVSVGIHTTYSAANAEAVINKVECDALCTMQNLIETRDQLWSLRSLNCPSLKVVAVMDGFASGSDGTERFARDFSNYSVASYLDWVCPSNNTLDTVELKDPFEARGAVYPMLDQDVDTPPAHLMTLLFTSGSSGTPKAVAVGTDAFVNDISGDFSSGEAISKSLTVSYIPLSHSSDRYKVWEHVVWGGRVVFCFFSSHHWEAHEKDKKGKIGQCVCEC